MRAHSARQVSPESRRAASLMARDCIPTRLRRAALAADAPRGARRRRAARVPSRPRLRRTLDALDLVLVGGGHAHVQLLRRLAVAPLPRARVTVVLDRPEAVYSGMVPGFAAGEYAMRELEIDVARLAQRAGAALVLAPATRIDAARRRIEIEGRAPLDFDLASLDVGGSLRGLELPGVREHALPTRPIRDFVDRLDARLAASERAAAPIRVAVVGGGAAGVELAFCLGARMRRDGRRAEVTLIDAEREPLAMLPRALRRRARAEARRRGVSLRTGREATRVAPDALWLGDERLP